MRNKELTLQLLEIRLQKIASRPDAAKCPGVMNRLKSEIKALRKELGR